MKKKSVYLDYAASTPVDGKVLAAMLPYLKKEYGNPSSLHSWGQKAAAAVEQARQQAAKFLGCQADEIVFISGATEANNLAVQGVIRKEYAKKKKKFHAVVSAIEHESVLASCRKLEQEGLIELSLLQVDAAGITEDVGKLLRENTVLVSVQYANSEIGTVQPVREIARTIAAFRKSAGSAFPLFHCDAVQAANFLDCEVEHLGVDMLTLSSHKIYGPKGAGLLFVKKGIVLAPLLEGGSQEGGARSGTENVAATVGMGRALAELRVPKNQIDQIRIRHMRDQLIRGIAKQIKHSSCTGSMEKRLPNNAHFVFEGVEGRDLVMLLDQRGIAVSTGSACSERSQEPSHVLLALGMDGKKALGSLRITLGRHTKKEDIERVLLQLPRLVDQLRASHL